MLKKFLKRLSSERPYVGYQPMLSSGFYVCDGCRGMSHLSVNEVIHNPDCPHYPSEGNRKLEKKLKSEGLFKGSKWDQERNA